MHTQLHRVHGRSRAFLDRLFSAKHTTVTAINAGSRVLITGAAGGLGLALAHASAARGAHLALADVRGDTLECAATDLRAHHQQRITTHQLDVADHHQLQRVRNEILEAHGGLDILLNNAGMTHYGRFDQLELADIERVLEVNCRGVVRGCHTFLPLLQASKSGHIVNMSSMAAISGMPRQSAYSAAKAAVRAFSEALAAELRTRGIRVSWMVAGPIATDILNHAGSSNGRVTTRLGPLLKRRGLSPQRAAQKLIRGIERNRGEIRLTISCELMYQLHRLCPSLVRRSMVVIDRLASRFEQPKQVP